MASFQHALHLAYIRVVSQLDYDISIVVSLQDYKLTTAAFNQAFNLYSLLGG
jgi:hypothetical protein